MTRIIHTGDLHLGMETHSRPDPETGLPSRLLDFARCWRTVCETAIDVDADAVVIAGDLFHSPNPNAAALNLFDEGLRLLTGSRIPTVIIPGNHDRSPHPGRACVLRVFQDLPFVRVVERPEVVDAGGIKVACLPSVSRHQLLAAKEGMARSEADEELVDALRRIIHWLRSEGADVLTGHWPVAGAILGNEKDLAIIPEPMLLLDDLEGPWPYAAFSHIHKHQVLETPGTTFAYSGSIERVTFGEAKEDKVACLVDLEAREVTPLVLPARRFVTVEPDDLDGQLDIEGAIVRLAFGYAEGQSPDTAGMEAKLYAAGAERVVVRADVIHETRARAADVTEDLSTEAALERWFEVRGIDAEERPVLRRLAQDITQEVR